jgi:hypothetical protein
LRFKDFPEAKRLAPILTEAAFGIPEGPHCVSKIFQKPKVSPDICAERF